MEMNTIWCALSLALFFRERRRFFRMGSLGSDLRLQSLVNTCLLRSNSRLCSAVLTSALLNPSVLCFMPLCSLHFARL